MKIIGLPTKIYESGDRVLTTCGPATVLHDELEGISTDLTAEVADLVAVREVVVVRLDKGCSEHPNPEKDLILIRDNIHYPLEESSK